MCRMPRLQKARGGIDILIALNCLRHIHFNRTHLPTSLARLGQGLSEHKAPL